MRQGMPDAMLRDNAGGPWVAVAQSPFAKLAPKPKAGAITLGDARQWAGLCVLIVILFAGAGFFHLVYGSTGLHLCAKDGWAIEDTLVDADDYIGKLLVSKLDKAKVVRALVTCGVVKPPAVDPE